MSDRRDFLKMLTGLTVGSNLAYESHHYHRARQRRHAAGES